MNLKELREECRVIVRKAAEADTEAWLKAGLPKGHGLPKPAVMAAQMVALKDTLTQILTAQRDRYVAYIKENPPTLAPISKEAIEELPVQATLTHHFWLDGVTTRREWWDDETRSFQVDEKELTSALHDSLQEAVGTGGVAARASSGALPPGFASITQTQARALLKEIAAWKTSKDAAAKAIYQAIADRAGSVALRGAVLRDGAGRLVAAVSYRIGNDALDVVHLGALERQVAGTGVQMVRELAAVAAKNGKGIALQAPAEANAFFTGLGFTSGTEGRFSLAAQAASEMARSAPVLGPAWSRVGWLQGPEVTVKTGLAGDFDAAALISEAKKWRGVAANTAEAGVNQARLLNADLMVVRNAEGKLVGIASYAAGAEKPLTVSYLATDPASTGVGRRTMRELAQIASQDNQGMKLLSTPKARGFYERLGMTATGKVYGFTPEQAAGFASGLTGTTAGTTFVGQISWELAVAGASDWLRDHKIKGIVDEVTTATHQALVDTLVDGLDRGQSTQEIAERIGHLDTAFGPARAERIARTEVITANRAGGYFLSVDAGCTEHEWRSVRQPGRTRAWHWKAHGQRVPIDQPFTVEDAKGNPEKLMFPGDTSLGATASNVIQCLCSSRNIKPGVSDDAALGIDQHGLADVQGTPGPVVAGVEASQATSVQKMHTALEDLREFVEKHHPGGQDHDQSTHGNWAHDGAGMNRVWLDHPFYGKETIREYVERQKLAVRDGKIVAYHGRPRGQQWTELRAGSYIGAMPEECKLLASINKNPSVGPEDIEVFEVLVPPDALDPGVHMQINRPLPLGQRIGKNLGWKSGPNAHWERTEVVDLRQYKVPEKDLAEFREYQRIYLKALCDKDEGISDANTRAPVSLKKAEQRLQAYLDKVAGGELSIRRNIKSSEAILDPDSPTGDMFLSQFTANTSSGTLDFHARSQAELLGLGVPLDADPYSRPVYAFLDRTEVGRDQLEHYGKVEWVLENAVKDRSTMTVGDSLAGFELNEVKGTPVNAPDIEGMSMMNVYTIASGKTDTSIGYIEAQIQGEVHLEDVKLVRVPRETLMPGMEPDVRCDRIIELAGQRGIPVEIYDPNADANQRMSGKP